MPENRIDVFFLGAGKPKYGTRPAALTELGSGITALEWQLHSFDGIPVNDFHFIGGYHVEAIFEAYPHLSYTVIADWQSQSVLHSLLKAPLHSRESIFLYADTIFRKEVIAQLMAVEGDVVFAFDSTWKNRYETRTAADIEEAETIIVDGDGFLIPDTSNRDQGTLCAEFTGAIRLSPKIAKIITNLDEADVGSNLIDLLEYLSGHGFAVRGCDIRGEWSEFNSPSDIAHFVLGTKAETLARLAPLVSSCTIGDQVTFTAAEWQADRSESLSKIGAKFSGGKLIIRSSAKGEDNWDHSNAGGFESILNVDANSPEEISNAVESVISSYRSNHRPEQDQILVQEMVDHVSAAGVVFTRGLENGAPYYRFNFDDQTSSTDAVTSGTFETLRTVIVHHEGGALLAETAPELTSVLDAVRDLERLLGFNKLDIEFAIDRNERVHIFQVRPITVDHSEFEVTDDEISRSIGDCVKQFERLQQANPFMVGKKTFFGNMPDWNPAEIIGTRPKPLAFSLYRRIITDEVWAEQRSEFGYRDVRPHPLIVSFCGQPYVDIRASLNSFVPASLSEDAAERLVEAYFQILQDNPSCHDKLEFEIAFTVWTPSFNEEARKRLLPYGLTENDIDELGTALRDITKRAFRRLKADVKSIETLIRRRKYMEKSDLASLDKAMALLDDCRRFGTLAFSHAARAGFVSTSFLKSLVAEGVMSEPERQNFMRSIQTVAGDFERDKHAVACGKLGENELLERYGHLRPGTYDASVEAYWESPESYLFSGSNNYQEFDFSFSDECVEAMRGHVHDLDPDLEVLDFIDFLREAIRAREYLKFEFTRNLSRALDAFIEFGKEIGLNRDQITFLDISDLEQMKVGVRPGHSLDELIANRQKNYLLTQMVELPQILFSETDFYCFERATSQPNFITSNLVYGPIVVLEGGNTDRLHGSIVLIQQADPGYDWLFSHDIAGLITTYGGANSHMAIRAAEMGLAAAIGVGEKLYEPLAKARYVQLDCANRVIRPTP